MVRLPRGNIDFVPMWKIHTTESTDSPVTSLLPQILGLIWMVNFILIFSAGFFLNGLLTQLVVPVPLVITLFSSPVLVLFIALLIAVATTFLVLTFGDNLEANTVRDLLDIYKHLDRYSEQSVILDVVFGVFLGLLLGILGSFLLMVPAYFFGIFFFYVFITFFPLEVSILFSFSLSTLFAVLTVIALRGKVKIEVSDRELPREYEKTKRILDIERSNRDPIVCPSCRSFISAESEVCPVCHDQIV